MRSFKPQRRRRRGDQQLSVRRRHLHLEALESRLLLAATPSVNHFQVSPDWFSTLSISPGQGAAATAQVDIQDEGVSASDTASRWILQLTPEAVSAASTVQAAANLLLQSGLNMQVVRGLGLQGQLLVSGTATIAETTAALAANPNILSFQQDSFVSGQTVPNDSFFSNQLGFDNVGQFGATIGADINAPEAWNETTGSTKVVIGVIDSGIDATHPDLYKNIWLNQGEITLALKGVLVDTDGDELWTFYDLNAPANASFVHDINGNTRIDAQDLLADPLWANGQDTDGNGFVDDFFGWNFLSGSEEPFAPNNPTDVLGHGTHVSGILGAMGNNSVGVAGLNWRTSIMALKFLDENNQGTVANAISAINYATMMRKDYDVNVRVTNNSWGQTGGFNEGLKQAIEASGDEGILFVAAAGNGDVLGRGIDNDRNPFYPANYDLENIISVAATTTDDTLARFSNFGAQFVDIAAPGTGIFSTIPGGGYAALSGTSMAAPQVAGTAALLWSVVPGATVSEIREAILSKADPIALNGQVASNRRLNARGALNSQVFAPNVRLLLPISDVITAGGTTNSFTVEYFDRQGVNATTIGNNDILVSRQYGPRDQIMATLQAGSIVSSPDGKTVTAIYRAAAPGGTWDPFDFGEYRISILAGAVLNANGVAANAAELGSFQVKIASSSVYYVNTFADTVDANIDGGMALDASGKTSLRAAIQEGNAKGTPVSIFLQAGTYALNRSGALENLAASGDLDVSGNITIVGDLASSTIIDAQQIDRVFEVLVGGTLVVERINVTGGYAIEGGGIQSRGNLTVREAIVSNNSTIPQAVRVYGGGIDAVQGNVTIVDSVITGNTAVNGTSYLNFASGGGLNVGRPTTAVLAIVQNSTIHNNIADVAAAIYTADLSFLEVTNSTISGNTASRVGGIQVVGTGQITNTTITNNSGPVSNYGVGLFAPNVTVRNSIIAGNSGASLTDVSQIISQGHNIFGVVAGGTHASDLVDPNAHFDLGPLQDNGGKTPTHALLPGSVALDRADPAYAPSLDQRGISRLQDGDGDGLNEPDVGAFERAGVEISGVLYEDLNSNGRQDANEVGLAGRTVFLDSNNNGILDPGETFTQTEADDPDTATVIDSGGFTFSDMAPGVYHVVQQVEEGWRPTIAGEVSTTRVSIQNNGSQFSNDSISDEAIISGNGRFVTFRSNDGVYVRDRQEDVTELIAAQGFAPSISADGRYVAYESSGTLFVFDRTTDTAQSLGSGAEPVLSADGRYVAYLTSTFSGIVQVRDRQTGVTQAVGSGASFFGPMISGDGRFVAYEVGTSSSSGFLYNRVSATSESIPGGNPDISDDGRWLVFDSNTALVAADTNNRTDVYLKDRQTNTIKLVSATSSGQVGNRESIHPVISGDGRYVAFLSGSSNLVAGAPTAVLHVYRYDNVTGAIEIVDVSNDGVVANTFSGLASINDDGTAIAYYSDASNILPLEDSNNKTDIFVRTLPGSSLISQTFTLTAGQVVENAYFGAVAKPGTIQGRVFDDVIPNGIRDLGEPGFAGWTIYLDEDNNGQFDAGETSTVSVSNGDYAFTNLRALTSYRVRTVGMSGRDLILPTAQDNGAYQVFVGADKVVPDRDFGSRASVPGGQSQNAIIQGTVFQDLDQDGVMDALEPGLTGKTVYLDRNDDGDMDFDDPRATTNGGLYQIENLGSVQGAVRLLGAVPQSQSNPKGNQFTNTAIHVTNSVLLPGNLAQVATGDFNNDGWQDVVTVLGSSNVGYANSVAILLNNAGQLSSTPIIINLAGAIGAGSLVTGNFNNIGQLDLAVVSSTNSKLSILFDFNPATNQFASVQTNTFGSGPSSIVAGNIDGDGDTDLILTNEYDETISILTNNGSGVFTQSTRSSGGNNPISVLLGHFSADSNLDMAVANFGTQPTGSDFGTVSIFRGLGGGAFAAPVNYNVGVGPASLAAQDFDGDGDIDLAVTNFLSNNVSLLLGQGNATFVVSPNTLSTSAGPIDISAADLENDGDFDIVVTTANNSAGNINLLRNRGKNALNVWLGFEAGQVMPVASFSGAQNLFYHAVANIDNDAGNTPDIIVANGPRSDIEVNTNILVNGAHRVALAGTGTLPGLNFGIVQQNATPTLNAISNPAAINEDAGEQTISLSGITAGVGDTQNLMVTASSDTTSLIPHPTVIYTNGQATGQIRYTPVANKNGIAHITVTVTDAGLSGSFGDGDDASFSRIFDVGVNAVNDLPVASADSFMVPFNSLTNVLEVLSNDTIAPDIGETLRVIIVSATSAGGTAVASGDRFRILYTPPAGFYGIDTFTYFVSDGDLVEDATVQVTVTPPGDYDRNGTIQQADYNSWRANFGATSGTGLNADGNGNAVVDAADYLIWRRQLPAGSGNGATTEMPRASYVSEPQAIAVPSTIDGQVAAVDEALAGLTSEAGRTSDLWTAPWTHQTQGNRQRDESSTDTSTSIALSDELLLVELYRLPANLFQFGAHADVDSTNDTSTDRDLALNHAFERALNWRRVSLDG